MAASTTAVAGGAGSTEGRVALQRMDGSCSNEPNIGVVIYVMLVLVVHEQ